jgi:fermentation-respiration switch protein FrsA (DUF1100 family)
VVTGPLGWWRGVEDRFVYHPTPAAVDWRRPPDGADFRDVTFPLATGEAVHAWWCPVAGAAGAVLLCHGNAGNLSGRANTLLRVQEHLGQSVLIFDYPGYGRSTGRPGEPNCYASAEAAYRWLTGPAGVPAGQVTLFGESLGGAVAVELARRLPHRALVLIKAFTSVADVARHLLRLPLPVGWLLRNRFDNRTNITQCRRPVLITHGTADRLIPFRHAEALFALANEPKRLLPLPGDDHNSPLPDGFYSAVRELLDRYAPATQPAGRTG